MPAAARTKSLAERMRFIERSRKKRSDASSRPRVERRDVIATRWPPTVAKPFTGPWMVSR